MCMLAHSFLIKSSSKLLVTRTGIKARMSLISGLWFPWPIYMFFEMRFDLGTLDSGERSLPFGLLVLKYWSDSDYAYVQETTARDFFQCKFSIQGNMDHHWATCFCVGPLPKPPIFKRWAAHIYIYIYI